MQLLANARGVLGQSDALLAVGARHGHLADVEKLQHACEIRRWQTAKVGDRWTDSRLQVQGTNPRLLGYVLEIANGFTARTHLRMTSSMVVYVV